MSSNAESASARSISPTRTYFWSALTHSSGKCPGASVPVAEIELRRPGASPNTIRIAALASVTSSSRISVGTDQLLGHGRSRRELDPLGPLVDAFEHLFKSPIPQRRFVEQL